MDGTVAYGSGLTADTNRMPSPWLWAHCPWSAIRSGAVDGVAYWNDFTGNYVLANNQTVTNLGEGVSGFTAATSGSTISMEADEPYGVAVLNSTTDNEDAGISILGGQNTAGQITFESAKMTWFEARIKQANIDNSKFNLFCGFAEEGLCATTGLISASDALQDKDLIGFQRVFADGDKLDVVYNTEGDGGVTTAQADAVTVAADTYVKIGIFCDGTRLFFFANGIQIGSSVLLTAVPYGEEMAFYFVMMLGDGADASANIDWVKIAQTR